MFVKFSFSLINYHANIRKKIPITGFEREVQRRSPRHCLSGNNIRNFSLPLVAPYCYVIIINYKAIVVKNYDFFVLIMP